MKKTIRHVVALAVVGLIFSGCAYKSGTSKIEQDFYKETTSLESKSYNEIGPVSKIVNGWLFSSCDTMGQDSLTQLKEIAKSQGADGVINVRWQGENGIQSKYPQCKTAWGWVLLWPAWFIPGTSDTTISGTMIKYKDR